MSDPFGQIPINYESHPWRVRLSGVGCSHTGKKRLTNQDRFYVNNGDQVFAVADGVGGMRFGERASDSAVKSLRMQMARNSGLCIEKLLSDMHRAVRIEAAQLTGSGSGIGTTITCLRNVGDCCEVGHVGDSRLFWIYEDGIIQLTEDHSVCYTPHQVGVVAEGVQPPKLTLSRTYLNRYLGQKGPLRPLIFNFRPRPGNMILLCSDGISGLISPPELRAIIAASASNAKAVQALIASAESRGGPDNQTAVIVTCHTLAVD